MENPLGFGMEQPIVSWLADSEWSKRQKKARIRLAKDAEMEEIIYDSEEGESYKQNPCSLGTELPVKLKPRTRYYWTVQVWGDYGDTAVSGINWFETGKRNETWSGVWITTPWKNKEKHPYFRRRFRLEKAVGQIASARLYVTGAGLYHMELNGRKIGREYFAPGCNALDRWIQVQTLDVKEYLKTGDNVIGSMLGNGWAKGRFGVFQNICKPYVPEFLLRAELRIRFGDGTEIVIPTDEQWECAPSPVLEDGIYDGELYDANKAIANWSVPAMDEADDIWTPVARAYPAYLGEMEDRLSLPVVIKEIIKPERLIQTEQGEQILDLGQILTGWLRFRVKEPKGSRIRIRYGEAMQDGSLYRENLRSAKAEYVYVSDGYERTVGPYFTFYGFRYALIEGMNGTVNLDDFEACVVYSDMEETGRLRTSDPWINRLYENAKWSQKGNFLDVPTDCPQRDERMGWSGDAQVFCKTASLNMETYAFYTKYLHDLWKEQAMQEGMVGNVVPSMLPVKKSEGSSIYGGAAAWGDAAVIIPWKLYEHYGDACVLRRQYQSMKAWVDWVKRQDEKDGSKRLWLKGFQFGDWLALAGPVAGGTEGGTDKGLIASAYYKYSAELTAKAAHVLGETEDEAYYKVLAEEIKSALQDEFYTKNGRCAVATQTAHILALAFDLVEDNVKAKTAEGLAALLKKRKMHLATGFVGTPLLCKALSDYGYSEAAYQVLLQEDYPGWLYEIKLGATTIWERWNSIEPNGTISKTGMNSLNHYAYGSIVQWMYENMCGIQLIEPGYKKFRIAPETYGKILGAEAEFYSPKGEIRVCWQVTEENQMNVTLRIPFDTEAMVKLPLLNQEEQKLTAGSYQFTYPLEDYRTGYSLEYSLEELNADLASRAVVEPLWKILDRLPKGMKPDTSLSIPEMIETLGPTVQSILRSQVDFEDLERKLNSVKLPCRTDDQSLI